jgi:hypothetical protein
MRQTQNGEACSACAGLHQIHKSHQVTVDVGPRILQGIAHTGLGREIYDDFRLRVRNETAEISLIGKVQLLENEFWRLLKLHQAGFLQIHIIVVIKIVDPEYRAVFLQQTLREVKANESGRPCNQNPHSYTPTALGIDSNMFTACSTGGTPFPG